jgi:ABC-type polysaccharide/polyol phosphate export permease
LPLLTVIQLAITLGIALLVATCNVFYRDLQQLVGYALLAIMFLTPLFYEAAAVPANLKFIVTYSPIAALVSGYQSVFYYGTPPDWHKLLFAAAFGAAILALGLAYFNRNRDALGEYV